MCLCLLIIWTGSVLGRGICVMKDGSRQPEWPEYDWEFFGPEVLRQGESIEVLSSTEVQVNFSSSEYDDAFSIVYECEEVGTGVRNCFFEGNHERTFFDMFSIEEVEEGYRVFRVFDDEIFDDEITVEAIFTCQN